MKTVFDGSTDRTPLAFVLSPGDEQVPEGAEKYNMSARFDSLSLGSCCYQAHQGWRQDGQLGLPGQSPPIAELNAAAGQDCGAAADRQHPQGLSSLAELESEPGLSHRYPAVGY